MSVHPGRIPLFIAATATELGTPTLVSDAVEAGRYDPDAAADDEMISICEAHPDVQALDMAVRCATEVTEHAGLREADLAVLLHASVAYQGLDLASPASFIQRRVVPNSRGTAINISQASNGAMAAIDIAANFLRNSENEDAWALVTTSDTFRGPEYDRFATDAGIILADGATAIIICRTRTNLELKSIVVQSDPSHEAFWTGNRPLAYYPGHSAWPINITERKNDYLQQGNDLFAVIRDVDAAGQTVVEQSLSKAALRTEDIRWFLYPNVGATLFDWEAMASDGILKEKTTWEWGRRVGHLGAGDQIASIDYLLRAGKLRSGDRVIVSGTGGGWSFSAGVIEYTEVPL